MSASPPQARRTEGRRPTLHALTGVRFLAAAHVVVYHYGRGAVQLPGALARVLDHGFAGVTLFFVLSGFILAYNHAGDGARSDPRDFWAARFARIYPVYALGLLLALPALLATRMPGRELALALTTTPLLLQGWVPRIAGRWNGPAWSLSAEALFYLAFPPLVLAVARLRRRGLLVLAGAAWATSLVTVVAYRLLLPDGPVHAGMATAAAPWLSYVRYHPLARLPEFVLGIAAGRLFLLRRRGLTRLPGPRRWAEVAAALAFAATLAVAASPMPVPFPLVHGGLLAPFFAVALYALAVAGGRGPISWPLSTGLAVRLGEASYALYILHVPLHDLFSRYAALVGWRPGAPLFFGAYFALAVAASVLVNLTFEVPARRVLRRWLAARSAPRRLAEEAAAQAA